MGANWNYAILSKMAKQYGGPEIFLEMLKAEAINIGKRKMIPYIAIASFSGIGIGIAVKSVIDAFRNTKSEENIRVLSDQIIKGIEEYDKEHPETAEGKQMFSNPFREESLLTFNDKTSEVLENLANDWDVMTDFGNNQTENDLIVLLTNHDQMTIYSYYITYKNNDTFDADALKKAVELFRIESDD